jgi:hypothetical protein
MSSPRTKTRIEFGRILLELFVIKRVHILLGHPVELVRCTYIISATYSTLNNRSKKNNTDDDRCGSHFDEQCYD